jgi:glyceraldehyde 3-phosphate dehydrogenase
MAVRLAINGFGRIGRCLVRVAGRVPGVEIVAINSRGQSNVLAHLLKYDSVHGVFAAEVEGEPDALIVGGKRVAVTRITEDLAKLPWKQLGVDVVMESTGKFRDRESNLHHLKAGAKKVIVSAPGKGLDATFVMGVNHQTYDPERHDIVSNASCTTNCLAPVAKVVHENFGIRHGLMTTTHSYTMDQRLLDGSHKDLRRARAAALSMVPTSTGAAIAVTQVIPALKGRLNGLAIRVPTPNVSLIDLVCELERDTSKEEINAKLKAAAEDGLRGIMAYSELPLVSVDYTSSPYSSIVDAQLTSVIGKRMCKVLAWYDNEYGFAMRMVELARLMIEKLS